MPVGKPEWETPELIVLVRNRPEESVLTACKTVGHTPKGPSGNYDDCSNKAQSGTGCSDCKAALSS